MENLTNLQINISDISIVATALIGFVFVYAGIEAAIKIAKG